MIAKSMGPEARPSRAVASRQAASLAAERRTAHTSVYRGFGSLVSLGRSTVGNLMGFLVGKNFFIEGYFARLMYRSLYKKHEAALHGVANVILSTIGRT